MGLFSRHSQDNNDKDELYDKVALPSRDDIDQDFLNNELLDSQPAEDAMINSRAINQAPAKYGIENAIALMRKLPRDSDEVVVNVVKQTLESTSVNIEDIIADAKTKEKSISQQHQKLVQEIKDLQDRISQRNQRIEFLQTDLKETEDVRHRLQKTIESSQKVVNRDVSNGAKATGSPQVPVKDAALKAKNGNGVTSQSSMPKAQSQPQPPQTPGNTAASGHTSIKSKTPGLPH